MARDHASTPESAPGLAMPQKAKPAHETGMFTRRLETALYAARMAGASSDRDAIVWLQIASDSARRAAEEICEPAHDFGLTIL